ncbi:Flp pilus assembly protein CpaB [Agrococcus terreus]|uniref:SAF domain-containing protein n=1 Tax=Agrococcus terreus TaxID=574649 RepID=A0ABQ2KLB6_9MICO|nr:Flp pilus assembly protein CpaB [Agrococcus terreus]GGN86919.1 hypothetical protein GCM10010968_20930 [Agrococcus terreus]
MIRRIIIGGLALVLAVVGGALTFAYATGADARAMARMAPEQVLVVSQAIPQGTPVESIAESLSVQEIPSAAVVPGALTDLSSLSGQVTTTELQVGEQLLATRFAAPEALPGAVEIPAGAHQLTIELESRRVLGGELVPGDLVGIFVTRDGADEAISAETHLVINKALVTDVRGGVSMGVDENGNEVENGPAGTVSVTIAVPTAEAELVVYAAEEERIWLSLESPDAPEDGTRIVDREVIFQ